MSLFSAVEMAPGDAILGVIEGFYGVCSTIYVNLGVGVYCYEEGKIALLRGGVEAESFRVATLVMCCNKARARRGERPQRRVRSKQEVALRLRQHLRQRHSSRCFRVGRHEHPNGLSEQCPVLPRIGHLEDQQPADVAIAKEH